MGASANSILLIGESGVGKTHYGAQLLKRLMKGDCQLRMNGAASNLEPFEAAMESLNEGMAADHTPTPTYVDSVWPIATTRVGRPNSSGRTMAESKSRTCSTPGECLALGEHDGEHTCVASAHPTPANPGE